MIASRHALLGVLCAGAALAQAPPAPDAKRYPELAAMKRWLETGSEQARHCARSGGLFLEASQAYREQRSEPAAVDALMKRHGETLTPPDRERLRATVAQMAGMAAGLSDLSGDSAPIAYSQLCIGSAQKPGVSLTNATIQRNFDAALRCEREHPAESLDRKECVAVAFKVR